MSSRGVTSIVDLASPASVPDALFNLARNAFGPTPLTSIGAPSSRRSADSRSDRDGAGTFPNMVLRKEDVRTDETLLQWHLAGDESAFPTLVERYRVELHGFLARFLGSSTAADDVFQDAFLQVHLSATTFDQSRNFKPWLFTIAANKARDFHRKRKRRSMASLDAPIGSTHDGATLLDVLQSDGTSPGERSERADQQALVKHVLDGLPEHHREVILLGYFQRMSYKQVADVLEIPIGTVKSRLHAAVAVFSSHWKRGR